MEQKKVLLVDDDPAFVEIYGAVFHSNSINFSVAANGTEALEKAMQEKPDLILLDIMLPDINGLDVLKRLKRTPETSNITVWMLSNLAEQINRETASSLGAADYIFKGEHTPKQVVERITTFFSQNTATETQKSVQEQKTTQEQTPSQEKPAPQNQTPPGENTPPQNQIPPQEQTPAQEQATHQTE